MANIQGLEWRETESGLKPFYSDEDGKEWQVRWAPQAGSQQAFLECPVFEALLEGNRGGGKTETLLNDYLQHVGQGFGANWRGILFRRQFRDLEDVIAKSKPIFWAAFPKAKLVEGNSPEWRFPDGEKLLFRHINRVSDYNSYHGHMYPWIGFEELTTWPDLSVYKMMFSCCRSSVVGMPRKVRATTNPYGVGHNVVKMRFRLPIGSRTVGPIIKGDVDGKGNPEPDRVVVHSSLAENKVLLTADPEYISRIRAAAMNPEQAKAWIDGSWDIVAGGMFDDLWDERVHLVEPFPIPQTWRIDRSFDWGSTKPFSVGWWAESNGETVKLPSGRDLHTIRGDLFRVAEWYGWDGKTPNVGIKMTAPKIAEGIKEREQKLFPGRRVVPGPADSSIFDDSEGESIASQQRKSSARITWVKASKGPGSRKNGAQQVRTLLFNANPRDEEGNKISREAKGLFIFSTCEQFKRTVPTLPRSDKDLDDVDTDAEDHAYDELRYRVYKRKQTSGRKPVAGR